MKITLQKISLFLVLIISVHNIDSVAIASRGNLPIYSKPATIVKELSNNSISSLLYTSINLKAAGLNENIFNLALKGFSKLRHKGLITSDSILTIIDYTKSAKEKRLFVIDLKKQELKFNTIVAHGKESGEEYARSFSNVNESNKSSLGFFITKNTYEGANGYSLKLEGAEPGFNDNAMKRAIVMHGADYVNESVLYRIRIPARSLGCPAIPERLTKKIIDKIKNGNALFTYYPDKKYLSRSKLIKD